MAIAPLADRVSRSRGVRGKRRAALLLACYGRSQVKGKSR